MMRSFIPIVTALSVVFSISRVTAAIAGDLVLSLPGWGQTPTPWYSGYLSIPGGKHLHYILQLSPNPSTDPVVSWNNGGRECF
jgi:hypothetical protein